ncbi:MAG: HAD-IIB family hydrolase [Oscillospiraceae bacterium]|nr:HAD-IIB family hydrolase [Oscillospiraceae bacterium]
MKVRAIFVDMDGTLLGRSQVGVSVRNMTALQNALEKGIHVIPCTGRVYNMLPPQLLTQKGLRYFVTSHGARVYDRNRNTSIYEDLIPAEQASALMALLEGKYLYNEIAANGTIYLEKAVADNPNMSVVPEHHIWYVRDNCFTAVEKPSEYFLKHNVAVEKMNIYGIPQGLQQPVFDAVTATGFIRHTRGAASANLEFSSRTLNKRNATDAVLDALGISYDECLAIGDSSTDLEIIQLSGIGVAMGNAPDDIKAAADYITGTNTEDGFALALEKYVL